VDSSRYGSLPQLTAITRVTCIVCAARSGTYAIYPQSDCKGTPSISIDSYDCATAGTYDGKANCEANTAIVSGTGVEYKWNSASSTAIATATAVAAVVAYVL
jgi:hypothetical protein